MLVESVNICNLCDVQDLEKVAVPLRSRLYHLEPRGKGTTYIESFTSYITRLSYRHCVPPRDLILEEVLPLLNIADCLKQENRLAWLRGSTGLNGMTPLVEDWVHALEQLTSWNTLRFLTMLTWSGVADPYGVVRKTRAWCPECYDEWLKNGDELYEPLIWTLRVIVKCPKHQRNLLCRCPYPDCQKPVPLLIDWSEPGCCPRCGRFLGTAACMEKIRQTEMDVEEQEWNRWVSSAAGELIAAAPGLGNPPGREMIASGITAYIERAPGGSVESLAHSLGVSGSKLRGWQKGSHLPHFSTLLQVCKCMGVSPLSFLTKGSEEMAVDPLRMSLVGSYCIVNERELRQRLEVILKSEEFPFPSIEEVAKLLKSPAQVLEHRFPKLCDAISRRYRQQVDADHQRAFLERVLVQDTMKHLSLNEVARRLGCRVTLLKYRFPDLCKEIGQRQRRRLDLSRIKLALDEIIAAPQVPPLSMKEVVLHLGCSSSSLYHHFPEACHTISRKYQEWLDVQKPTRQQVVPTGATKCTVSERQLHHDAEVGSPQKKSVETSDSKRPLSAESVKAAKTGDQRKCVDVDDLRQSLECVLASNEEPFPSITEIAKRLGYTSSTLYRYFPAMCHAITRKSHRVIDLNDVRQELEVILAQQDGLLPSLKEIGKRVYYPETSLRRHFPELCRAIVERRRNGVLREFPVPEVQPERWFSEDDRSAGKQKKREDLDEAQKALEKVLDGDSYPSMIEVAQQLGFSASSLYHYFSVLCRTIAMRHKQQKDRELQHLKSALEEVLASDQRPYPTMQEVAKRLKCNDVILYNHFPELCYAIAKRHRPNLSLLQQSLEAILESPEIPPSISETARRLGCSAAILRYHFPDHCKTIIERHRRLNELETQRKTLVAVSTSEQVTLSVNEIARLLGCSSSVLYARFPELCQAITERRWSLSNKDELRQALEAALVEEPPPTFQEVARRLDCPPKNIEYYYPDLCKAIACRYREGTNVSELQKALEAYLALEEPVSLSEAARQLGVTTISLRKRFPELSRSISRRYMDHRRERRCKRIQRIREEIRQAALLLHAQGIYPNTTRVGEMIGVPARFRMPEAREALRDVLTELGYR
jgi:AcrR family transcriptional regulator/predicted DNA-binding transcriptional regulator AlpA/transcriptional regulator with XRE-family HTH domain